MSTDRHPGEHSNLSATDIDIIVQKSVRNTLTSLGINISSTKDLRAVQADFAYMRRQRVGAENIAEWIKKTLITAMAGGALYALWTGIKLVALGKGITQ